MIRVAILGSTGSIGRQALDVIRGAPDQFEVVALAGGRNIKLLVEQALEFRPAAIYALPSREADALRTISDAKWSDLEMIANRSDIDVLLTGTDGLAGLPATIAALRAGTPVAIANKESLVVGGNAVISALKEGRSAGAELRPVDSEHSAIWQCLWGEQPDRIERLTLTASGGAFRDLDLNQLDAVTPEQAVNHPNWDMGKKITVDSATLFNKGLEAIEARWLFNIPLDRIDILQHRESVIHSMVTFADGSVKAQLGEPDMGLPIQIALAYPDRVPVHPAPSLDLAARGALHFGTVENDRFPCLDIALEAGRREDTTAAAISGADEAAVAHFLANECRFTDIPRLLTLALESHQPTIDPDLDTLLDAEQWGHHFVDKAISSGLL